MVVIDPEDRAAIIALAREEGVDIEDLTTRALEPVSAITLLLVGSALAIGSLVDLIDRLKGGQVVDLRPGADRPMYRSKDVTYGLVVIRAADGTVTVEVKEPKGMFGQVVDTIRGLLSDAVGQSTATIEEALRDVLGDRAAIESDHG